jgi:hypothetical protein
MYEIIKHSIPCLEILQSLALLQDDIWNGIVILVGAEGGSLPSAQGRISGQTAFEEYLKCLLT